jgi:integrase
MGDIARKRKNFATEPSDPGPAVLRNEPPGYAFNAQGLRIDLSAHKRFPQKKKDIAWHIGAAIWRRRMVVRQKTIETYISGLDRFFEFLDARHPSVLMINEISTDLLEDYIYWAKYLAERRLGVGPLASGSPLRWWKSLATLLLDLQADEDSPLASDLVVPWGVSRGHVDTHTKPYSIKERDQILRACYRAIEKSRRKDSECDGRKREGSDITRLVPYLLLLAIRTGFNAGVLLGLEVGCAMPSQIAGLGWVRGAIKYRNGRAPNHPTNLESTTCELPLQMREVDLIEEVTEITRHSRAAAAQEHRKFLWLVSPCEWGTKHASDKAMPLSEVSYAQYFEFFSKRYDLKDDAGKPLVLNLKRCRPSFAEGLLKANGGDLWELSKRLDHANLRTTMRYVDPNQEDRKRTFRFAGLVMQAWGLGTDGLPDRETLIRDLKLTADEADRLLNGEHNMGLAKCRNPWNSPVKGVKPGEACSEFLVCLRCPNMVVLREDAHRLFSFYWYIHDKQYRMDKRDWNLRYRWILEVIDKEIAPKLGRPEWIEQMKADAKAKPHPLWSLNLGDFA